jgi:ribosomal protein S18 acetylase RimI-like enzyme
MMYKMRITAATEQIEFRKVVVPDEIDALCEVDRRIFHAFPADLFSRREWAEYESYWMLAAGKIVGCSAFVRDMDYNSGRRPGCLYIMTTGVLPEFRRRGFGLKQKQWQIEFAKQQGFRVIVTNMRESNASIIRLNQKLGFAICMVSPAYYSDPTEPAIVMELQL